jgi:molecular chaperone IbpA
MLDQPGGVEGSGPSYPPYNIERTGENAYRISVAMAGFSQLISRLRQRKTG